MEGVTRSNYRIWMITIYLFLMAAFIYAKPSMTFGRDGQIRPFGTSSQDATVFPLWYWVFMIAAVSYFATVYIARYRI